MAKGTKISTTAKITDVTAKRKQDVIKFEELQFSLPDNAKLAAMVRKGTGVYLAVQLDMQGEKPIQSSGLLVQSVVNVTNQNPQFNRLRFSPDQHAELIRLMRSEAEVKVTIEQPQGDLFDDENNEGDAQE